MVVAQYFFDGLSLTAVQKTHRVGRETIQVGAVRQLKLRSALGTEQTKPRYRSSHPPSQNDYGGSVLRTSHISLMGPSAALAEIPSLGSPRYRCSINGYRGCECRGLFERGIRVFWVALPTIPSVSTGRAQND